MASEAVAPKEIVKENQLETEQQSAAEQVMTKTLQKKILAQETQGRSSLDEEAKFKAAQQAQRVENLSQAQVAAAEQQTLAARIDTAPKPELKSAPKLAKIIPLKPGPIPKERLSSRPKPAAASRPVTLKPMVPKTEPKPLAVKTQPKLLSSKYLPIKKRASSQFNTPSKHEQFLVNNALSPLPKMPERRIKTKEPAMLSLPTPEVVAETEAADEVSDFAADERSQAAFDEGLRQLAVFLAPDLELPIDEIAGLATVDDPDPTGNRAEHFADSRILMQDQGREPALASSLTELPPELPLTELLPRVACAELEVIIAADSVKAEEIYHQLEQLVQVSQRLIELRTDRKEETEEALMIEQLLSVWHDELLSLLPINPDEQEQYRQYFWEAIERLARDAEAEPELNLESEAESPPATSLQIFSPEFGLFGIAKFSLRRVSQMVREEAQSLRVGRLTVRYSTLTAAQQGA